MALDRESKKVHLILGAGGIRAISFVGALRELTENGISFTSVSTSSAGTLIGALLSAGMSPAEIEEEIQKADLEKVAGKRSLPWAIFKWPYARYKGTLFPELLVNILGRDPIFADLEIPLATIAVDLISKRMLVYASETHPQMKVSEALGIATAVPFLYPPYVRNGRILVDGAIVSELPVWLATRRPETTIPILVLSASGATTAGRPTSIPHYISRIIEAGIAGRDDYLIEQIARTRRISINCGDIEAEDFDLGAEKKVFLFDAGRKAANEALKSDSLARPVIRRRRNLETSNSGEDSKAETYAAQIVYNFFDEVHMGHKITAGGNAIVNIDSQLENVSQIIGSSNTLTETEKGELGQYLTDFRELLDSIKESHSDEVALITKRLDELVEQANKPKEQRKKNLLDISAKGLLEAAKAVAQVVPSLLPTAEKIARFIVGLV